MPGFCEDNGDCGPGEECSAGVCISTDADSGMETEPPCEEPIGGCDEGYTWSGEPLCYCIADPPDIDVREGGFGDYKPLCDCADFYICLDDDCDDKEFLECCSDSGGCPEGYECKEDIAYNEMRSGDPELVECCFPKGLEPQLERVTRGCTDPEALNYDPDATFDCGGSPFDTVAVDMRNNDCCVYPGDGPPGDGTPEDDPVPPKNLSTAKCDDPEVEGPLIETYQSCFPNPQAVPPNWIDQPEGEPFLNQKTCEYSIVIFADPPDCSEEYINSFIEPAVSNLLSYYTKAPNTIFVNPVNSRELEKTSLGALTSGADSSFYRDGLQFFGSARVKDFYIPPRLLAKTKILVTVSAEEFNRIPEKEENLFEEALVGTEVAPSYVVFSTNDMTRIFDVVARSFRFFEVPYIEWTLENGKTIKGLNLVKDADKVEKFYNLLKSLIEESYESIFRLESIKINFNSDYKIESIMATEPYSVPVKIEKGFDNFLEKPLPNNQTLMAYVSRLPDMREDLMARTPLSWYDLLEKYRYPEIEETYISDVTSPVGEEFAGLLALSEAACPAGSSAFEPKKTPGQWLGAEANSIAQALLNKLQENPCAIVDARILEAQNRNSLVMEVTDLTLKEYLSSDRVINDLPVMMANAIYEGGGGWSDIGRLYQTMLDNLGYCGWLDLIKEALDCVLNALGYEDSIGLIVGAAVRGMSNEQFSKFIGKLPPEMIEIITASVSETAPQLLPFLRSFVSLEIVDGEGVKVKPVHDLDLAYSYTSAGVYREFIRQPGSSAFTGPTAEYPPPSAEDYKKLNEVIYDLIVNDLLGVDQILGILETMPGASIALDILQKMDKFCVAPPKFYPPLNDFIKLPGVNVDFCAIGEGGIVTPIPGAVQIPKLTLAGLGHSLIKSAGELIKQITKLALILVLRRIIELIYEEACKNKTPGDPLGLRDALRSRCGDALTDEQLNQVAADAANIGCVDDPAIIGRFIDNVSSVITECEFVDLVNGVASENIYNLVLQIMKVDPVTLPLAECLGDRESLSSFFRSIGFFVDLESLCIIQPQDVPFGQSVCEDLNLLELFRSTRAEALREKGVDEECINDQLCRLRDRTLEDLEDLMGLLHGGIENVLPDLIKDPDSDKEALLPSILPSTEMFTNSVFGSMFDGIEMQFAEDVMGRRGFINMALADSRGRGYVQHHAFQRLFGPRTFNIYGSRGTRAYPPRDEWGKDVPNGKRDWNDWITKPIDYTDDAAKFIWMPFLFNPLGPSGAPNDGEEDEEAADEEIGGDDVDSYKGRPPAIGGLPDKVAGYLQEQLDGYSTIFSLDGNYTVVDQYQDYDYAVGTDGVQINFSYDYYKKPPAGRTNYDYDGYRVEVETRLGGEVDTTIKYTTDDPLLPEVSDYIRNFLSVDDPTTSNGFTAADHWANFVFRRVERVMDLEKAWVWEGDLFEPTFKEHLGGPIFSDCSEGFMEMIARDISKTDIFNYGYDREGVPDVVYFHEDDDNPDMTIAESIERYGGSEANPPFYIKEPESTGFLKIAKSIIPEIEVCDDEDNIPKVEFPNYKELVETANAMLGKVKDDKRLSKSNGNLLNVIEAPFDRALPAAAKALNESLIYATIRTYLVEFMLKSLPVFNFVKPGYPDNYTNLLTEYIIEYMEEGMKETGRGNKYRPDYQDYWWLFLEQAVQSFRQKVQKNIIDDASESELKALESITETVERNWKYYKNSKDPQEARDKKKEDWQKIFEMNSIINDCKVILRRYVGEELERMGDSLASILPDGAINSDGLSRQNSVDDLILVSEPRPTPIDRGDGSYEVPYVAGAVNRSESGPVDVAPAAVGLGAPGATHPLDEIGGIAFEDRNWPFVLERYMKVDTEGLDPGVHGLGTVINIFDWQNYVESTGLETIPADGTWKFGMRLSLVMTGDDIWRSGLGEVGGPGGGAARTPINEYIIPGADFDEKAYTENYKYLIPLVGVELPIVPDSPGQAYSPALYSNYIQPLICKLIEMPEYKLTFKHIFPIARYLSYFAVYAANTFVPSLGRVDDGWAATTGPQHKGGGQNIGWGIFGGMKTWRGNEGTKKSFHKTKTITRQLLEASSNTNYLYEDRDAESPKEAFVRNNRSDADFDAGLKWWQWSSLRPPPCKKKEE